MAAGAVPVVIGIAEETLSIASQIRNLTGSGDHQQMEELAARVAELSQKVDQLKSKLDLIASEVADLFKVIDASREETFRVTLWGAARVALLNMGAWSRHPQKSLSYIIPELTALMNATQNVIGGVSLIGVPTMGFSLAAHAALFELLLKTDQRSLARPMYSVALASFQKYFQQSAHAATTLGDQAKATQADAEARLRGYTLSVAPHPNAPPPGPYIPSEPRIWRGNCLAVWHCSGSLATGYARDSGITWTRLNSVHTDHDPATCEPDGNELGNDFPLTSLDELNGLSSAYQRAGAVLELSSRSGQAANTLLQNTDQLIEQMV